MKKLLLILALALLGTVAANAQTVYSCKYKSDADVKVYVTEYKSDADLVVYKCSYKSDAQGNKGLWYFVDYKSDADIIIYFTQYKSDAGWKNKSKLYKME